MTRLPLDALKMSLSLYHLNLDNFLILRALQVPEEIHEEWKKGGANRARLQELFAQCGFDKVGGPLCLPKSLWTLEAN